MIAIARREAKSILRSKTFWIDLAGIAILIIQFAVNNYIVETDLESLVVGSCDFSVEI